MEPRADRIALRRHLLMVPRKRLRRRQSLRRLPPQEVAEGSLGGTTDTWGCPTSRVYLRLRASRTVRLSGRNESRPYTGGGPTPVSASPLGLVTPAREPRVPGGQAPPLRGGSCRVA